MVRATVLLKGPKGLYRPSHGGARPCRPRARFLGEIGNRGIEPARAGNNDLGQRIHIFLIGAVLGQRQGEARQNITVAVEDRSRYGEDPVGCQ